MIHRAPIMLASKRALLAYLVCGQWFLIGCGAGTSQSEMRRRAIKRKPDIEESDVASPAAGDKPSNAQPNAIASPQQEVSSEPVAEVQTSEVVASEASPARPTPAEEETVRNGEPVTPQMLALPPAELPAESLSPAECRERTANNLTRIGKAWRAYLDDKGHFPGPAVNEKKQPLLSWRVELLPYLGLQSLYDAFHLDEAWDSPHNYKLLGKIPRVFQSPERFDAKTNYVALSLSGVTVYQGPRQLDKSDVEDGVHNTLALVEADDQQAVPWTQPTEFPLVMAAPLKSLGNLRESGLFVVWSDGTAAWINRSVNPELFAKACTAKSGDGFRRSQITSDLAAGIAVPGETSSETGPHESVAAKPAESAADTSPSTSEKQPPTLSNAQAMLQAARQERHQTSVTKQPIPSAANLKVARDLLRELFQADYAAAKTAPERLRLAREMLDRLPDLSGDVPGQYALLEVVTQISIQAGGVDHALDAIDQMTVRFQLDDDAVLDTLEKLARTARDRRELARLLEEADRGFDDFVLAQDYGAAERLSRLAVSVANQIDDTDAADRFTERRQWAEEAKDLHDAAEEALATLEQNPEDPRANGAVGKFHCLIKNDWENGLVILANGNDRSLKRLAQLELGDLSDATRKLELADLWWREAESAKPAFKSALQSRAKYWYEQTLPSLPAGLVRIRVERRLEEVTADRPNR